MIQVGVQYLKSTPQKTSSAYEAHGSSVLIIRLVRKLFHLVSFIHFHLITTKSSSSSQLSSLNNGLSCGFHSPRPPDMGLLDLHMSPTGKALLTPVTSTLFYRLKSTLRLKQAPVAWSLDTLSSFFWHKASPRLQISQNPRGIFINQSKYANEILKKFDLHKSDPVDTPMVERTKLDEDLSGTPCPLKSTFEQLNTVLSVLQGTINMGLCGTDNSNAKLHERGGSGTYKAEYIRDVWFCAQILWMRSSIIQYLWLRLQFASLFTVTTREHSPSASITFSTPGHSINWRIYSLRHCPENDSNSFSKAWHEFMKPETHQNVYREGHDDNELASSITKLFSKDKSCLTKEVHDVSNDDENKADNHKIGAELQRNKLDRTNQFKLCLSAELEIQSIMDVSIHQEDLAVNELHLLTLLSQWIKLWWKWRYLIPVESIHSPMLTTYVFIKTHDNLKTYNTAFATLISNVMIKKSVSMPIRSLPIKNFENDQTYVARLNGKQHKASSTKDETSGILKSFITEVENRVDKKVKIIRCDNGTEFKNRVMSEFCEKKGIKKEFSIARTPQQNGVAERRNRTLIEAARTIDRTPALSFMRQFGCHVTILNTLDYLGKFDGDGLKWLFDIDVLTKSMNYVPVVAGTNSNDFVGTEESIGAGHSSKETRSSQDYILMPLWKDGSLFDSSSKNDSNDESRPFSNAGKKDDEGIHKESGIDDQERPENSSQDVNTVGPSINTASTNVNTGSLNINIVSLIVTTALLEATHANFFGDEIEIDMITTTYLVPSTLNTRIHKDHSLDHVIGDVSAQKRVIQAYKIKQDKAYAISRLAGNSSLITGLDLGGFTTWQKSHWVTLRRGKDNDEIDVKSAFLYGKSERKFMSVNLQGVEDP
ncbi:putative ribonuclease H-like domain-containing protein [Tanacetum coccineum]